MKPGDDRTWTAYRRLKKAREWLSFQQYRTLKGQMKKGDVEGALRGLDRLQRQRRTTR